MIIPWQAIETELQIHAPVYIAAISSLFVAGVCTMPTKFPTSPQEWWTWMRDTFQTAVPAARTNHSANTRAGDLPPNPIQTNSTQPKP